MISSYMAARKMHAGITEIKPETSQIAVLRLHVPKN